MFRLSSEKRFARRALGPLFVAGLLLLAVSPAAAEEICYDLEGQMGVWVDALGTLESLGIEKDTPFGGFLQFYAELGVGSVELEAGSTTLSADVTMTPVDPTLYFGSFGWILDASFDFTYGDVRFEGPTGWLSSGLPANLEEASYGWGYFYFVDTPTGDYAEFWIAVTDFVEVACP